MREDSKKQEAKHIERRPAPSSSGGSPLRFAFSGIVLITLLVSACPLYNPAAFVQQRTTPNDVLSTATQVTVGWDPPSSGALDVVSYVVSYRIHGTTTWNKLATVSASSQPSYVVQRSVIGSGSFDFAVAAVYSNGNASPLHTSLDPTADPTTGWYLSWGQ